MKPNHAKRRPPPIGPLKPVQLTPEQRRRICAELSQRRDKIFHDSNKQASFLGTIEHRLGYLRMVRGNRRDLPKSQERVQKFAKALAAVQEAYEELGYSEITNIAPRARRDLVEHYMVANEIMLEAAREGVESLRMPRGAHDPPPGREVRYLVHEMAGSWRHLFGKKPSPEPDGAFFAVVKVVLGQLKAEQLHQEGETGIGKDALRSLLNPSG